MHARPNGARARRVLPLGRLVAAVAYGFTDEEQLIRKTVRDFAQGHGLPRATDNDRHDRLDVEALQAAAGLGLLGLAAPTESGGSGASPLAFALAVHEVARVDPDLAILLGSHAMALRLALHNPGLATTLAAGELGAVAWTEEAHGSDTASAGARATKDPAGWRLTGQKVYVLGAAAAKHFLVLARAPDGLAFFHVPASAAGLSLGRNEPMLALRATGLRTLYLSDVKRPAEAMVSKPGAGQADLGAARLWLQVAAAASLAGCMAGSLEAAARFAEGRKQFGAAVGTYQAVSDTLTNMDIQLAAARALTWEAASLLRTTPPDEPGAAVACARAKAFASDAAVAITRSGIRVQGGTGFMREGGTERFARCARALQFVGETAQMQRDLLKRDLMPGIQFPAAP